MKKLIFTLIFVALFSAAFAQTADLNGVTFGFGAGYSYTFQKTYDYSLTTDANHNLQLQSLSKQAFVISSVVMIKLGKLAVDPTNNQLLKQSKKEDYLTQKSQNANKEMAFKKQLDSLNILTSSTKDPNLVKARKSDIETVKEDLKAVKTVTNTATGLTFWDHLSVNASLDLANIAPTVSFNKTVNGGLGLGYVITDDLQLAVFYDITQVSQLRDYVVASYLGKPIPNGSGTNYTSLSTTDNNLFYNKTLSGFSFKLIFSLASKKAASTTP